MATFTRTKMLTKGYDAVEVDDFFDFARRDYEEDRPEMTAAQVRRASFALRRGGYAPDEVDAALDRLEDALAARERDGRISHVGEGRFMEELTGSAAQLQDRFNRPAGERFRRARGGDRAYDTDQVDALMDTLSEYFRGGPAMSPDDVRQAAFAPKRGSDGYREADVDAFLDRVVEIMAVVV